MVTSGPSGQPIWKTYFNVNFCIEEGWQTGGLATHACSPQGQEYLLHVNQHPTVVLITVVLRDDSGCDWRMAANKTWGKYSANNLHRPALNMSATALIARAGFCLKQKPMLAFLRTRAPCCTAHPPARAEYYIIWYYIAIVKHTSCPDLRQIHKAKCHQDPAEGASQAAET